MIRSYHFMAASSSADGAVPGAYTVRAVKMRRKLAMEGLYLGLATCGHHHRGAPGSGLHHVEGHSDRNHRLAALHGAAVADAYPGERRHANASIVVHSWRTTLTSMCVSPTRCGRAHAHGKAWEPAAKPAIVRKEVRFLVIYTARGKEWTESRRTVHEGAGCPCALTGISPRGDHNEERRK